MATQLDRDELTLGCTTYWLCDFEQVAEPFKASVFQARFFICKTRIKSKYDEVLKEHSTAH